MEAERVLERMSMKDLESLGKKIFYRDGKQCTTAKGMQILWNNIIEAGDTTIEQCMRIMQQNDAQTTDTKSVMAIPCLFCGKKFGLSRCAGCPNDKSIRYCSKECQLGAWPVHKAICASRQIHAVVNEK